MIKFEIFYNEYYKNTHELVKETIKGKYLYIDQVNELLLIDNIIINKLKNINSIRFVVNSYYQTINIANPNTKIYTSNKIKEVK